MMGPGPRTLFEKIWDAHVVQQFGDGTCVLYIGQACRGPALRQHFQP